MSANLKILVPEATTNYILNPSIRYDTTGFNAVGSTVTRVLDYSRFGIASLKVVTNGAAIREGTFYRVSALVGISEPITVSAYVRGRGRVHIRLIDNPAGREWVSQQVVLRSDRWTRMEVSGFSTGRDDMRLYVETDAAAQAITFYADGFQMERKPYSTTYCDGEQPGCRWNVIDHNSLSTRDPYTRVGGHWLPLAGPCRFNDDIYVTVLSGLGMPPITNNLQPWALAAGSFYQNTKINDRVVTLNFTVKKKDLYARGKPDLSRLHKLRQQLVDVIKPDRTVGGEPFMFSYQEGDRELFLWARYEAGLEGQWDIRNQWVNSFPIRLLVVDPFFTEDSQEAQNLSFFQKSDVGYVSARINGEWTNLNYGISDPHTTPLIFCEGRRGEIYLGGDYLNANNNAAAVDPIRVVNHIAMFDGTKWNDMAGGTNGHVQAMAIAPNGDLYASGNFTIAGGVVVNRIAKWNGTAWSALGTGLNDYAQDIKIAPNGDVYVAGLFTTAGGIPAYYIAKWSGGAWHSIGPFAGLNAGVLSIAISKDGTQIYFGGTFTDQFSLAGSALLYVCSYNPTTNTFAAVGSGFNFWVRVLALSNLGKLYAGGEFTSSGATTINRIAQWNGSVWVPLGTGTNDKVRGVDVFSDETLIIVGDFTTAGGLSTPYAALWNGSTWTCLDCIEKSVPPKACSVMITSKDDIYMETAVFFGRAGVTKVQNAGTAESIPLIYLINSGEVRWIENFTTKQRIYLNLNVLDGEEIFIDFKNGILESTVRGSLLYSILPGSSFSDFKLLPGENKLCCFMVNDVLASMYIYHTPQHWSADASKTPEALS